MIKRALIFGISGQDGSYLAKFLLSKNYIVYGTTRNLKSLNNLKKLKILEKIKINIVDPKNYKNVKKIVNKIIPHEIYYLSGVSSIFEANNNPQIAFESITLGTINVLESIKHVGKNKIKAFFAGSTECYGNLDKNKKFFDENSTFSPENTYSFAKLSSYNLVKKYREIDGLNCCTGILSNHESPLRSSKYISKKIIERAKQISKNKRLKLKLGNIDISRDWGWAPEFVEVYWKILNLKLVDDFIIASGKTTSLKVFIKKVFKKFDLDWENHIIYSKRLQRKSDIKYTKFNLNKIYKSVKWKSRFNLNDIIDLMIKNEF